jgi:hypothetical protein
LEGEGGAAGVEGGEGGGEAEEEGGGGRLGGVWVGVCADVGVGGGGGGGRCEIYRDEVRGWHGGGGGGLVVLFFGGVGVSVSVCVLGETLLLLQEGLDVSVSVWLPDGLLKDPFWVKTSWEVRGGTNS